jgi:hypothetical protein
MSTDEDWPDIEDWDDDNFHLESSEIDETIPKLLEDPYIAKIHDEYLRLLAAEKQAQLEKQLQEDYMLAFQLATTTIEEVSSQKKSSSSSRMSFRQNNDDRRRQKSKGKKFIDKSTQTDSQIDVVV